MACILLLCFTALAMCASVLVTVCKPVGAVALAVGPPLLIICLFYQRYHCSTQMLQVVFTFVEAISWMAVLLAVIGFIDAWNYSTFSRPVEVDCSWDEHQGKVLVAMLSYVSFCSSADDATGSWHVQWHGQNCSDKIRKLSGATTQVSPTLFHEVTGCDGEGCAQLKDAIGSVTVLGLAYGNETVEPASHETALPLAYEVLFSPGDHLGRVRATLAFRTKTVLNAAITAYFRAGFLEELLKYVAVRRILFKDRVADCGGLLMYGLAAAAGFAAAENLMYVFGVFRDEEKLVTTARLRMFMSIPLHCCTGLIIGIHLGYRKFLGRGHMCLDKFLLAMAIPVFIHGTYDFCLMLPAEVTGENDVLLACGSGLVLVLAFVYARCAWRHMDNVCVVHVKDLAMAGRVSRPRCCCCECDNAMCLQRDPLLRKPAPAEAKAEVEQTPEQSGPKGAKSSGDTQSSVSEAGTDESSIDREVGQQGEPSEPSRSCEASEPWAGELGDGCGDDVPRHWRLARSLTNLLVPEVPKCQTRKQTCPGCTKRVRMHVLFPSECPYCRHGFPDPAGRATEQGGAVTEIRQETMDAPGILALQEPPADALV